MVGANHGFDANELSLNERGKNSSNGAFNETDMKRSGVEDFEHLGCMSREVSRLGSLFHDRLWCKSIILGPWYLPLRSLLGMFHRKDLQFHR